MKKILILFVFVFFAVVANAQYMYSANSGKNYAALFIYENGSKFKIYIASKDKPTPIECLSGGVSELLGKKLVSFRSDLLYFGKPFYIEFTNGFNSFNIFDNKLTPLGTYYNDSKSFKGGLNLN